MSLYSSPGTQKCPTPALPYSPKTTSELAHPVPGNDQELFAKFIVRFTDLSSSFKTSHLSKSQKGSEFVDSFCYFFFYISRGPRQWGQVYIILTIQLDSFAKGEEFPFLLSILSQCQCDTLIIFTIYSVNLSL